jgi:hypothetical protein
MAASNYLVFGDLHGRVLHAFRFASLYARETGTPIAAILQVGDLGYFPDLARIDKATLRHAKDDPSELGVQDVIQPTELADRVFDHPDCPEGMWFTAGNHEDYEALELLSGSAHRQPEFVVDAYCKVRCVKNGCATTLPGGLTVGALWGVDGVAVSRRTNLPPAAYISDSKASKLLGQSFSVLLTHDAPLDGKRAGCGSEIVSSVIALCQPEFHFFGHYRGEGKEVVGEFGRTRVLHMGGFELHGRDGSAEPGSVGVLRVEGDGGKAFEYVDPNFLRRFSRHNWKYL